MARLYDAELKSAELCGARLGRADLGKANLKGAIVTDEPLARARSLVGTILPDGSVHQ